MSCSLRRAISTKTCLAQENLAKQNTQAITSLHYCNRCPTNALLSREFCAWLSDPPNFTFDTNCMAGQYVRTRADDRHHKLHVRIFCFIFNTPKINSVHTHRRPTVREPSWRNAVRGLETAI